MATIPAINSIAAFVARIEQQNLFLQESQGDLILKGRSGKLSPQDIALIKKDQSIVLFIKKHKQQLVEHLKQQETKTSLDKSNIAAMYELSPVQEGMLFYGLLNNKEEDPYTQQTTYAFLEEVAIDAMKGAIDYAVKNHSILRTSFVHDQFSIPVQCVFKNVNVPFAVLDFSTLSSKEQEEKLDAFLKKDFERGFDFKQAPLLRLTLIQLGPASYKLIFTTHHILLDGWSMPIIMEEIMMAYQCLKQKKTLPLIEEDRFEDFIQYIRTKDKVQEEKFWKSYVENLDSTSLLPFVSETVSRNNGGTIKEIGSEFDRAFTKRMRAYAQKHHITINTIVQGAWAFLLAQYTGNKDILYGVTVSGRPTDLDGAEERVGMFINTIPLRIQLNDQTSVIEWLQAILANHTQTREFQYTAINAIQNWSGLKGDFFDSIIVFENYPDSTSDDDSGADTTNVQEENNIDASNYLVTVLAGLAQELQLGLSYNSDLLRDDHANTMLKHLQYVIQQLIEQEDMTLADLQLLSSEERRLVLGQHASDSGTWFNRPFKELHNHTPINVRFEQIADQYKTNFAVIHKNEKWTYKNINNLANQVAHTLKQMGVKAGDFVGVHLERSPTLVSCLMGILKCGAVYVPLDTQNPAERTEKMIEQNDVRLVISTQYLLESLDNIPTKGLLILNYCTLNIKKHYRSRNFQVQDLEDVKANSTRNPENQNEMSAWAYMLFTSGSTGAPKGAITRHDGAMNHLLAEYDAMDLANGFRFLQSASIGSDISVWQILGPILKGGTAVIMDKMDLLDYPSVLQLLEKEQLNVVEFVPSYLWGLVDFIKTLPRRPSLSHLQWIMLSGEQLPVKLVNDWRKLYPHVHMLNAYGPCEASDDITQYKIASDLDPDQARVPIGTPIHNMNIVLLDEQGTLCPIGVAGEIGVTGVGVGAGYYGLVEKTAASFVPNPFEELLGNTLYKTGDLGRWLPDGNIEFLGRIDRQVKIRGNRVELGEIESALRDTKAVKKIHVMPYKKGYHISLVAFVVAEEAGIQDDNKAQQDLQAILIQLAKSELPTYMQPKHYCFIDNMPFNLSDKVDEKALIQIFAAQDQEVMVSSQYVAPKSDVERKLATMWEEALNIPKISVQDDFFDIGGDSLSAIRLLFKINTAFATDLHISVFFQYPSIRALAQKITYKLVHEDDTIVKTLQTNGTKRPIFCVPGAGGNVLNFAPLSSELGKDQTFYAFQTPGLDGKSTPPKSIEAMASLYVEEMLKIQTEGPYCIGGYSLGGLVALEMAIQLHQKGIAVDHLILFDGESPDIKEAIKYSMDALYQKALLNIADDIASFFDKEINLSPSDLEGKPLEEQINIVFDIIQSNLDINTSKAMVRGQIEVAVNSLLIENAYEPTTPPNLNIPILYIETADEDNQITNDNPRDKTEGWQCFTQQVIERTYISGDHETFLQQPHVKEVATFLNQKLNQDGSAASDA